MSQEKQPASATGKFNERIQRTRMLQPSHAWQASDLNTILDRFHQDKNLKNNDTYDRWVAQFINRQTRLDKPGAYNLAMVLMQETAQFAKAGGQPFTCKATAPEDVDSTGRIVLNQRSYDILCECIEFKLSRLKDKTKNGHATDKPYTGR